MQQSLLNKVLRIGTIVIFSSIFLISSGKNIALAEGPEDTLMSKVIVLVTNAKDNVCNPTKKIFEDIAKDQPQQSIVRFGYNYDTVRFLKLFYNVFGVSIETLPKCIPGVSTLCGAEKPENCSNFILVPPILRAVSQNNNQMPGSLLGMFQMLSIKNETTPIPVNLAYFIQDETKNIPLLNKTFAADATYSGNFLGQIKSAWKFTRNMAYAAMAIIIVIIGIMITMRATVDTRTTVTIQYALPKLIVAFLLIGFSYPIGAVIASTGQSLSLQMPIWAAKAMTETAFASAGTGAIIATVATTIVSAIILIGLASVATAGTALVIILVIVAVVFITTLVIVEVRYLITYIKILMEIIMAPITFMWAAIPGNDAKISMWFKKMLAYCVILIALRTLPIVILGIGGLIMLDATTASVTSLVGGAIINSLAAVLFMIIGIIFTIQAPPKIEAAITGEKKR